MDILIFVRMVAKGESVELELGCCTLFYWYLSGATSGLRAEAVERPEDLILGDVIAYDFEDDGRWNHTTIVVAKDADGMPLVNAHSANSRRRYWNYEDSSKYTPQMKYKFFHIING